MIGNEEPGEGGLGGGWSDGDLWWMEVGRQGCGFLISIECQILHQKLHHVIVSSVVGQITQSDWVGLCQQKGSTRSANGFGVKSKSR